MIKASKPYLSWRMMTPYGWCYCGAFNLDDAREQFMRSTDYKGEIQKLNETSEVYEDVTW